MIASDPVAKTVLALTLKFRLASKSLFCLDWVRTCGDPPSPVLRCFSESLCYSLLIHPCCVKLVCVCVWGGGWSWEERGCREVFGTVQELPATLQVKLATVTW